MSDLGRHNGPLTDKSGSGSTSSASVAAQNSFRKFFTFQNLDASIVMWLNFGADATAGSGSIKVVGGGTFTMDRFVSTDAINVIAASGTPAFTAKEG